MEKASTDELTYLDGWDESESIMLLVSTKGRAPRLIVLSGEAEVTFGRAGQATVVLEDASVSRYHARFIWQAPHVVVEDLGSRNGIAVGGLTIRGASQRIRSGDVVRIGETDVVATSVWNRFGASRRTSTEANDVATSRGVIVAAPEMRRLFQIAARLGRTLTTTLIVGETGVGKELIATEIHRASPRAAGPFVCVNCASFPETLIESELFGYESGAFTGATRSKLGVIECANLGTLFLDEVGELSLAAQAKILRVLETHILNRLGGTTEVHVDMRLLTATHRDLEADVRAGRFREDLLYRISAFTLRVPPLRARPSEVTIFAELFALDIAQNIGSAPVVFSTEAMRAIHRYPWPGNVRELRNAIEHAIVLAEDGFVRVEHLPETVGNGRLAGPTVRGALDSAVANVERETIEAALAQESGSRKRTAQRLGISPRALLYKLAKHGIGKPGSGLRND